MANVVTNLVGTGGAFAVLPSAARTATPDSFEYSGLGRSAGIVVVVDVTAIAATPGLTVTLSGVDGLSGKTWTILASASITGTGTTVLKVRPGLIAAANLVANDVLPPVIRITATHADADSITYSVAAYLTY